MSILRKFSEKFIRPAVQKYLSKERSYNYGGITIKILPGVFHPAFFFSTKFLLKHLEQFDLKGKKILELGAGSGLISFTTEKNGADVVATDLSEVAIKGLQLNKEKLQSKITITKSDLFDQIPQQQFDFIIINPPYYPKNPTTESELAWFCGKHFEYFVKLFSQLNPFVNPSVEIIMILSEECDILTIEKIAAAHGFNLKESNRKKIWWEWNFIFKIKRITKPVTC
jgi:release factor glutamine methyltransferase